MELYFFTEMWFNESPYLKLRRKVVQYLIRSYKENNLPIQGLFIYLFILIW